MPRTKRFIAMIVGLAILLTGCWDRTELNELAITSATGIDWDQGEWIVSYQVVIPSAISAAMSAVGGGAAKLPIIVYSTKGKTIREAVSRSSMESPRHLFFSHNRVVIVSEEAARKGLNPLIDVYFRNADSRETVTMLIAEGKARWILEQLMQIQIIPGDGIQGTMKEEAQDYSALPYVRMFDLAMSLVSPAKSAVIPEILVSGSPGVTTAEALNKTSLTSKLRLGRLAVFNQDKMVGWLGRNDAMGVAFIRNRVEATVLAFPCRSSEKEGISTIRLTNSTTKLIPKKIKDQFVMKVKIEGEGTLMEADCSGDLIKPETVAQIEKQLEEKVKEMVLASWSATRKLKTDVVGFADVISRKYPKEWMQLSKNWAPAFEQIEIEPDVKMSIKRMGLSNKSFKDLVEKE